MCVCVCVCVRERERERGGGRDTHPALGPVGVQCRATVERSRIWSLRLREILQFNELYSIADPTKPLTLLLPTTRTALIRISSAILHTLIQYVLVEMYYNWPPV